MHPGRLSLFFQQDVYNNVTILFHLEIYFPVLQKHFGFPNPTPNENLH